MIDFYTQHPEVTVDLVRHSETQELCYLIRKKSDDVDITELWSRKDLMRFHVLCATCFEKERDHLNETFENAGANDVPTVDPSEL